MKGENYFSMKIFENIINDIPEYRKLSLCVDKSIMPICVAGVSSIHKAHIIHSICKNKNKKSVFIASNELEANNIFSDLISMGSKPVMFPFRDMCFRDVESKSKEYEYTRINALIKILEDDFNVVVCCIDALLQYTIPPSILENHIFKLKKCQEISINELIDRFISCGYERYEQVEGIGQFSLRGGILDFYPPNSTKPIRIEFFGDEIDTISYFEADTQRRIEDIEEIAVCPASEVFIEDRDILINKLNNFLNESKCNNKFCQKLEMEINNIKNRLSYCSLDKFISLIYDNACTLLDYMSKDSVLFISEYNKVEENVKILEKQWLEDLEIYLNDGTLCKELDKFSKDLVDLKKEIEFRNTIYMNMFSSNSFDTEVKDIINFKAYNIPIWKGQIDQLYEDLNSIKNSDMGCLLLLGNQKYAQAICADLIEKGFNATFKALPEKIKKNEIIVSEGGLSSGIRYDGMNTVVISHGQVSIKKNKKRSKKLGKSISSLSELTKGSYVVHSAHGIGIFEGVHQIRMNGITKDYIKISYDKKDTLYVPVTQMDMVSKYVGTKDDMKIKLSKLGGTEWQKTKKRVKSAVKDIAKDLIKIYSERMKAEGYAFSEDNEWQRDFESKFEYEETQDQLESIEEIKKDMQRKAPMDRLLCGDVGFGKTEVALRAAFKCIADGKQCAMLVPTTILAWQHFQTAIKRFDGFPMRIEILSRFRKPKQQEEILRRLSRGEIDFIIGTHRLVQKDVRFRDLGLVIIDEEQRFGVAHKEKFKEMASNVDVLTLSATPIPRTLNMAMSGIRDMSTLEEAPQDRHPVQTYVMEYDRGVIFEAISKEIRRGGQVYYLHNKVESIEQTASIISMQIKDANVGIAHGRMTEAELSEVWRKMLEQEINVLVCTTIIETGIDVPNANTLIIENADCMGLSQLHQLRGRVGRSSRRAYAYFTFRRNKLLSEISQKRLNAIKDFTEFGSGFKIAMRDLELRGVGNIIGAQQHGNMADVGYDMYLKLLSDAVKEENGEKVYDYDSECLVDIQVEANIPESYIKGLGQRLDVYKRISDIRNNEDASDVIDELIDRFGDIPKSVKGLINVALIRNISSSLGIYEIKQNEGYLLLYQKKLDLKKISGIMERMNGLITVNAGSKPYVSIRIKSNEKPIDILSKAFNIKVI